MTKFIDNITIKKRTKFLKYLDVDFEIQSATSEPNHYDFVKFVGSDKIYGDVFLAWSNGFENDTTLYFGEKGDEFENDDLLKRGGEKTKFIKLIDWNGTTATPMSDPSDYDFVELVGSDSYYGDVFKAWKKDSNNFLLYFGKKGGEFNF